MSAEVAIHNSESYSHQEFLPRDLYDISAELELIAPIHPRRRANYLYRSIVHDFDEHFARLRYGDGVYGFILPDGRAEFLGVDMTASWLRTAEIGGYGSRDWLESMGYVKAMQMLQQPDCHQVFISSPQKDGVDDRRYGIILEKEGNDRAKDGSIPIKQCTVMIGQERIGLEYAQQECHALLDVLGVPFSDRPLLATNADLLTTPLAIPEEKEGVVYEILGIDMSDILLAKRYHDAVDDYLGERIYNLVDMMCDYQSGASNVSLRDIEACRDVLFILAKKYTPFFLSPQWQRDSVPFELQALKRMTPQEFIGTRLSYQNDDLIVYRGNKLPCQTVRRAKSVAALSSGSSLLSIGSMSAMEARMDKNLCRCIGHVEPHFHCDGENLACDHPIPVGHGITVCQKCGKGKVC